MCKKVILVCDRVSLPPDQRSLLPRSEAEAVCSRWKRSVYIIFIAGGMSDLWDSAAKIYYSYLSVWGYHAAWIFCFVVWIFVELLLKKSSMLKWEKNGPLIPGGPIWIFWVIIFGFGPLFGPAQNYLFFSYINIFLNIFSLYFLHYSVSTFISNVSCTIVCLQYFYMCFTTYVDYCIWNICAR